jgi:hypothetical protein
MSCGQLATRRAQKILPVLRALARLKGHFGQEIWIRMALGADRWRAVGMMRQTLIWLTAGQ